MFLIRLLLKLFILPIVLILTLIQWLAMFVTSCSAFLFQFLAGLIFVVTALSYLLELENASEAMHWLRISFGFFIIPQVAEWLILCLAGLNQELKEFANL